MYGVAIHEVSLTFRDKATNTISTMLLPLDYLIRKGSNRMVFSHSSTEIGVIR